MKNLYKANLRRLAGNVYFIGGCVIAMLITYLFTAKIFSISFLGGLPGEGRMYFVSAAMVVFFTIIIPIFTNMEYTDGTIRNKIIAGYSQKEIYLSLLFTYLTLALIMWGCYMAAGLAGGAKLGGGYLASNLVVLLAVANYIATMQFLSFRIRNLIAAVIAAMMVMNLCFNSVLFGNAMLTFSEGSVQKVLSILYNFSAFGQWFSRTGFADDITNPGTAVQILLSLVIVTGLSMLGILGIDKRDLA